MLYDEEDEAYLEELGRVFEEYRDDEEADLDDLFLRYPPLETIEHWFKAFNRDLDDEERNLDDEEEEEE
jgi:hypothetical protein